MRENKQARHRSAHGSVIPVREGNGTNELWDTIPYHLQPNNTRKHIHDIICALENKAGIKKQRHVRIYK